MLYYKKKLTNGKAKNMSNINKGYPDDWDNDFNIQNYDETVIDGRERRRLAQERNQGRRPKKNRSAPKAFLIFLAAVLLVLAVILIVPTPRRTVFLVAGTDEDGTRTDAIMLASLNSWNGEITLLSIPRDTYIKVSEENYKTMRATYPEPARQGMKITEIHHYAGEEDGMNILKDEIERNFGVDIDYYARVDFDAFAFLVDSIGGVEFDVPQDMDFEDPTQDLYIHLKKGNQVLDGDKAEQLMRFRYGYANQDLGRVSVQQAFVKTFAMKALKPSNVLLHGGDYVKAIKEYIKTDFKPINSVGYLKCVFSLKDSKFETATIPGAVGGNGMFNADFEEFNELYGKLYK